MKKSIFFKIKKVEKQFKKHKKNNPNDIQVKT